MESAFGASFQDVRVHEDSQSSALTRQLNAAAFTLGNDIYVRPGAYQPESPDGRYVLAHELAHVIQQRGASWAGQLEVGPAEDSSEREADRIATGVVGQLSGALPQYLQTALNGGQPDPGQYVAALQDFRAGHSDATLLAYQSRLGEAPAALAVTQLSPLQVIRPMAYGGGGAPALTPPTTAQIAADPTVAAALNTAWSDSNPNAAEVPSGSPGSTKKEQGGWILWNGQTGAYQVSRVPAGTRDGLAPIVGTRPSPAAPWVLVAWFHTHPNKASEGYVSDPSPGDLGYTTGEAKVPGIIKTHDGDKFIPYP
jgi:hypothetical protein